MSLWRTIHFASRRNQQSWNWKPQAALPSDSLSARHRVWLAGWSFHCGTRVNGILRGQKRPMNESLLWCYSSPAILRQERVERLWVDIVAVHGGIWVVHDFCLPGKLFLGICRIFMTVLFTYRDSLLQAIKLMGPKGLYHKHVKTLGSDMFLKKPKCSNSYDIICRMLQMALISCQQILTMCD